MDQELIRQEALKLIRKQNREKARRYREKLKAKGKMAATFVLSDEVRAFLKAESERTGESAAQIVEQAIKALMDAKPLEMTGTDRMILDLRQQGETFKVIAERLNQEGLLTATGRPWKVSNIQMRHARLKGGA